jgi:hypothetical protein
MLVSAVYPFSLSLTRWTQPLISDHHRAIDISLRELSSRYVAEFTLNKVLSVYEQMNNGMNYIFELEVENWSQIYKTKAVVHHDKVNGMMKVLSVNIVQTSKDSPMTWMNHIVKYLLHK